MTASRGGAGRWATDALLVAVVLVWGVNYSVLKRVFAGIDPMAFNALRFSLASVALLAGAAGARAAARRGRDVNPAFYTPTTVAARDWFDLCWLGLIGHCAYQWGFSTGLSLTSVSSSALIMATTPVMVSTASAVLGRERLRPLHWAGIATAFAGVVCVVGLSGAMAGDRLSGDLFICAAAVCWALFTFGSSRLMTRHSPLLVSGATTAIGTAVYVLVAIPRVTAIDWRTLGGFVWGAAVFSGLLSIAASYLVWYAAIQRLGPARTSIYANMVPIAAMGIAAVWLGEALTPMRLAGAGAVLTGVLLTRMARPVTTVPTEE